VRPTALRLYCLPVEAVWYTFCTSRRRWAQVKANTEQTMHTSTVLSKLGLSGQRNRFSNGDKSRCDALIVMSVTRCLALAAWRPYGHGCHINPPKTRETCLGCKWRPVDRLEKSVVGKRCKARVVRQAQIQIRLQVLCHPELRSLCIFDLEHLLSQWVRGIPQHSPHHPTVVCSTAAEQQPAVDMRPPR
jgi:hypothetical protein